MTQQALHVIVTSELNNGVADEVNAAFGAGFCKMVMPASLGWRAVLRNFAPEENFQLCALVLHGSIGYRDSPARQIEQFFLPVRTSIIMKTLFCVQEIA